MMILAQELVRRQAPVAVRLRPTWAIGGKGDLKPQRPQAVNETYLHVLLVRSTSHGSLKRGSIRVFETEQSRCYPKMMPSFA